ncbi:MAG TPA: long-chain-acyl-CoA synthetase, partial [Xanthobacteraceae bacterium]|nr:long-chain-acyl-CoA synthetase [Xanthobacteraceae bacterium]
LAGLRAHLHALLPDYARPLFLRVCGELAVTMTFKQKKIDLVAQGFDPAGTSDAIYFDDPQTGAFVPIDPVRYARIVSEAVRL